MVKTLANSSGYARFQRARPPELDSLPKYSMIDEFPSLHQTKGQAKAGKRSIGPLPALKMGVVS